jgi:hypothetical protein
LVNSSSCSGSGSLSDHRFLWQRALDRWDLQAAFAALLVRGIGLRSLRRFVGADHVRVERELPNLFIVDIVSGWHGQCEFGVFWHLARL